MDHDPAALEHLGGSGSRHLNAQANLSYAQVPRATVWWHRHCAAATKFTHSCPIQPGWLVLAEPGAADGRGPSFAQPQNTRRICFFGNLEEPWADTPVSPQLSQETDGRTISKYPLKHGCHWLMQCVFSRQRASTASDSPAQPAAADGRGCHHSSPESRFLRRTGCSP